MSDFFCCFIRKHAARERAEVAKICPPHPPHTAGERLLKGVEAAVTVVRTRRVEAGKTEGAGSSQSEKGAQSVTEEGWPLHAHAAKVADSWAKEVLDQIKTFSKNTEAAAPHPQV